MGDYHFEIIGKLQSLTIDADMGMTTNFDASSDFHRVMRSHMSLLIKYTMEFVHIF